MLYLYEGVGNMKKHFIVSIIVAALLALFLLPSIAKAEDIDVDSIVEKIDKLYRSESSKGEMEMTIVSENWTRTLRMDIWSEGMDKTFIHVTYPKKDAGISTLRIKNEMWNFFPKINKVMKVPPSMMMSSWMGSDFTNDDIVKESSMIKDYDHRLITPAGSEPGYYYVELVPKKDIATVWAKIIIKARKEDYIPVLEEYYDEKGNKMRTMELSDIRVFSGKRIPAIMELVPLNKEGNKTIVKYTHIQFNIPIDKDIFTLRNLQKRR